MTTIAITSSIRCGNGLPIVLFGGMNVLESRELALQGTTAAVPNVLPSTLQNATLLRIERLRQ